MPDRANQPKTHSILHSSQVRKRSQSSVKGSGSVRKHYNNEHEHEKQTFQDNAKFKYNYKYSAGQNIIFQRSQPNSQRKSMNSDAASNQYHQSDQFHYEKRSSLGKQAFYVCEQIPNTKPRYSLSFANQRSGNYQNQNIRYDSIVQSRQSIGANLQRNRKVKRDIDMCLYNLTDRLKQSQIRSKKSERMDKLAKYEERKNKLLKMHPDKPCFDEMVIHRIDPELLNQYINTVYQEYEIPDPLKQNNQENCSQPFIQNDNNIQSNDILKVFRNKNSLANQFQSHIFDNDNNQNQENNQNIILGGNKSSIRRRTNNHLANRDIKIGAKKPQKKFLNVSLSQGKALTPKPKGSENTPPKNRMKPEISREQSGRNNSKSHSLSKKSNSEKKIIQLKNDISNVRDSEDIQVERYGYTHSPYEIIHSQSQLTKKNEDKNGNVKVQIHPFQDLIKANSQNFPSKYQSQSFSSLNQGKNGRQMSRFSYDLKQAQSMFITNEGEVLQDFRYCFLCQNPILSANILMHEEKCKGWIHEGRLYTFKDLYKIQDHQELIKLLRAKMDQIQLRIKQRLRLIEEKQKQKNQGISFSEESNKNIVRSVETYLNGLIRHLYSQKMSQSSDSLIFGDQNLNNDFKKVQKNYKNLYCLLMQDINRLHWFVRTHQNYHRFIASQSRNLSASPIGHIKRDFSSTRERGYQSAYIVEDENSRNIQEFKHHQPNISINAESRKQ